MRWNNFISAFIICSLLPIAIFCQKKDIDSLRIVLATEKEGPNKVNTLNELGYSLYFNSDYAEALQRAQEALAMSERLNYLKGKGFANINIGCYYLDQQNLAAAEKFFTIASDMAEKTGDKRLKGFTCHAFGGLFFAKNSLAEALGKYKEAIKLYKEVGDKKLVAHIERVFGMLYYWLENYAESLEHSLIALKYFKEIQDEDKIATTYSNIGTSYSGQYNYPEALKNFYLALKHFKDSTNKKGIETTLQEIAGIYYWQGKYEEAIEVQKKCLKIRTKIGDEFMIAQSYMSIGNMIIEAGRLGEGLEYFRAAQKIYNRMKDASWGPGWCYNSIADVYQKQGDSALAAGSTSMAKTKYLEAEKNYLLSIKKIQPAIHRGVESEAYILLGKVSVKLNKLAAAGYYLQKGLSISKEIQNKENLRMAYLNLSILDSVRGNFKQAYVSYRMYILYRDSLSDAESVRKSEGYKLQYEFEKKEDQIKLLSTENKLKTTLASKQKQQKEFAFAGIAAILFAGGYGFYRYQRRKKLQSQQAVLSERLRISSELHDEVGATLSGIAMYSHLTKEQMKSGQTAEIEKSLNIMQQSSAQMVDKLSDIVWLINPEQDSLQKLVTRLEEYATDMVAIKNMHVKIDVPEKIAEINLPVESRRNIYLFCKEAINNAVKYSNATLLELTVKEVNRKLEFSVSDNGKGFDAVLVRRGNGLENMQKRADEIGAKLVLQSKENGGVSVCMQCVTLA